MLVDPREAAIDTVYVDGIRRLAFKAHQYRHIGTVADAGQGQGAIQVDFYPLGFAQLSTGFQVTHELARRHHWANGVGA